MIRFLIFPFRTLVLRTSVDEVFVPDAFCGVILSNHVINQFLVVLFIPTIVLGRMAKGTL